MNVTKEEVEEVPKNITKPIEPTSTVKNNCKGSITEISVTGNVTVYFNQEMVTEGIDLKHINSSNMDLYILPAMERDDEPSFNVT